MAYDAANLQFSNTSGATTAVTTIGASGATSSSQVSALGAGFFIGGDRYFMGELFVHSAAGTVPALAVKFQDATTLAGTYTDMDGGAFPSFSGSAMGIRFTSTTLVDDDTPLRIAVRTKADRPYVRHYATSTGTGQINTYSVLGKPIDAPAF